MLLGTFPELQPSTFWKIDSFTQVSSEFSESETNILLKFKNVLYF